MNQSSDVVFMREYRILTKKQKLSIAFTGLLSTLLIAGGYVYYQSRQIKEVTFPASYGLQSESPLDTNIYDSLFLSAMWADERDTATYIFNYDFNEGLLNKLTTIPSYSYNRSASTELLITVQDGTTDLDRYQPVMYNSEISSIEALPHVDGYNETNLVISPDDTYYAYGYQESKNADAFDIGAWNIALHNRVTGEVVTINAANEPHFVSATSSLFYMTRVGVYRYDLAQKVSRLVSSQYDNLSAVDDLAVAPDLSSLILTLPQLSTISVQDISEDLLATERGRIVQPGTSYRNPVLTEDGKAYAVIAESYVGNEKVNEIQSLIRVEGRFINMTEVTFGADLEGLIPETLVLNQFSN